MRPLQRGLFLSEHLIPSELVVIYTSPVHSNPSHIRHHSSILALCLLLLIESVFFCTQAVHGIQSVPTLRKCPYLQLINIGRLEALAITGSCFRPDPLPLTPLGPRLLPTIYFGLLSLLLFALFTKVSNILSLGLFAALLRTGLLAHSPRCLYTLEVTR